MSEEWEKREKEFEEDIYKLMSKYGYNNKALEKLNDQKKIKILSDGFAVALKQMMINGDYDNPDVTMLGFTRSEILKIIAFVDKKHPKFLKKIKLDSKEKQK